MFGRGLATGILLALCSASADSPLAAQATEKPGTGAWANYDFVPGDRVLFYEDFANDRVGDFPRRLEFLRGNWEVVEWQGRRLLRNTGPRHAAVQIPLPSMLPERFTIEIEAHFPHANRSSSSRPRHRHHRATSQP